ncbi:MAG: DedA family protein [candidate division Zixibacteria bacterium]|nr:DedA family protein [candidate division Zixibacteria bacterium]
MSESLQVINQYLDYVFAYGTFWVYAAIFLACFIENITPPFPGDSFIVAAGGLIAVSRLTPLYVLISVIGGGMCSIMVVYYLGRRYGRDFFMRKNYRLFSAADIVEVEAKFKRHGGWLLIVSRFVVGFRVILALAAGMGKYSATKMAVYTGISYVMFASLLVYLGYKLIEHLDVIEHYFKTYNYIGWPLVAVLVVLYIVRKITKTREGNGK